MAFVVTAGQLATVQSVDAGVAAWGWPQAVSLSPQLSLTYRELWRAQPQLRTIVGFLARNVAQLSLNVFEKVSDTDRRKLPAHPVARMLERPFPGSKLTKYRLLNGLMHDLCIYDNAYLLKRNVNDQLGLCPISPISIAPKGSTWGTAEQYRIFGDRGEMTVDADQVIHIYGWTPGDLRQGTSPVETLRQILAEEYAATRYREQLWRNGARVAGYIQRPKDAPRWSPEARERFGTSWQAQYTGDGPQSGGTPVLEDGMIFANSGVSPKDAQYVESRKLTREEVAVAFHVSPSMVGNAEGTTFSSMRELHQMLYQDTLAPYLQQIAQDLECQLLEDIDPRARDGTLYIEFNLAEKLRGNFEEQSSAVQSATGGPWMTRNEARALFNMSDIEGGDELIVPLNVITGGLASPNDTAPDNPSTEGNPKARALLHRTYQRQCNAVLSRLGAGMPDTFERWRWDPELADDLVCAGFADEAKACEWAAHINARTAERLAPALAADNPKDAVRRVFADLAGEA